MSRSIAVFGEMLWDLLPTGKQPGGAPMNVAIHLHNLGMGPALISRVGEDDLGRELIQFVMTRGIETHWIQRDPIQPTGTVNVNMDDAHEVSYEIVQPVAWDYIQPDQIAIEVVQKADILVYESLACRNEVSFETLKVLLSNAQVRVFDTNLRPPYYDKELLEFLLKEADLLKINHHELEEVAAWLGEYPDMLSQMKAVKEAYQIGGVLTTRGANGAIFMDSNDRLTEHNGFKVEVEDTIGAGDSFLAAFLSKWSKGKAPAECLEYACALGAMVAARRGANPKITDENISLFIAQQDLASQS
ncbi:MAG: carbohydrate kinase [Bacteroidota bacterium]